MQKLPFLAIFVLALFLSACQPKISDPNQNQNQDPVDIRPIESQAGLDFVNKLTEAVKTKNYKALEADMLPLVEVVKVSTDCCGKIESAKAISQLSYLDLATGSWNFDGLSAPIIGLKETYPQFFGTTGLIGISENGIIIGFEINTDQKIVKIVMAGSYKTGA